MPTATNGLRHPSEIMTDMIHTLPMGKVGKVIGVLDAATLLQVDAASGAAVVLGGFSSDALLMEQ